MFAQYSHFVYSFRRNLYFGKRVKLDWNRGHRRKAREEINFVVDPVHLEILRSRGITWWCRKGWNEATKMHARNCAAPQSLPGFLYSSPLLYRSENRARLLLHLLAGVKFHQFYRFDRCVFKTGSWRNTKHVANLRINFIFNYFHEQTRFFFAR